MPYGTTIKVKDRIGLQRDDMKQDGSIVNALAWADARIDMRLAVFGLAVSSTVPPGIVEASSDFAAYYILRNTNPDKATRYMDDGDNALDIYIRSMHVESISIRTGVSDDPI